MDRETQWYGVDVRIKQILIVNCCEYVGQIFSVLTTYVFPDKIDCLFAFYHR